MLTDTEVADNNFCCLSTLKYVHSHGESHSPYLTCVNTSSNTVDSDVS